MKRPALHVNTHFLSQKKVWGTLLLIAVAIGAYYIFSRKEKPAEEFAIVATMKAEQNDVGVYGEYVGRIRAQQFVEVHARVEGFLEQMLFEEGTYVKKNQTLFIIDQRQYKAQVDKASAQLNKDRAQERKAQHDLERIRPLYEQNAASQLDLDNAVAAYESAKASVIMSQADLDQAQMELDYTVVRSPIAGNISERLVDLGTLVGTNGKSQLATIVKSDTVLVDFSMTALDYLKSKERNVNLGQKVENRSWQPYITITLAAISLQRSCRLCRTASRPVDRNIFGTRRDAQSRPCTAAGPIDQSAVVARRARKRRNRTYESRHHRKRRGLHIRGS